MIFKFATTEGILFDKDQPKYFDQKHQLGKAFFLNGDDGEKICVIVDRTKISNFSQLHPNIILSFIREIAAQDSTTHSMIAPRFYENIYQQSYIENALFGIMNKIHFV